MTTQDDMPPSPDGAYTFGGMDTYEVRFGLKQGMSSAPVDATRFTGPGMVTISDDAVVLTGSRSRLLRTRLKEARYFPLVSLFDVHAQGNTVRFVSHQEGKKLAIRFEAKTDAQAWQIVERLGGQVTAEFAAAQAELAEFHDRLARVSPKAPVTPVLVVANVLVFVAMCIGGMNIFAPDGEAMVRWGSNLGSLTVQGQWWRLFTSTFLHFGILHLALNMWALWQTGPQVERLYGSVRFAIVYVFAGLMGSMVSLLWHAGADVNGAGASGAIFGVFGGVLAFVINSRNRVPRAVMLEHRNSTLLFGGYSLFYGAVHTGIDNAAHLGGLAGGFVMGLLLARPIDVEARRHVGWPRLALSLVGGAVLLFAAAWPLVHPSDEVAARRQFALVTTQFGERERVAIDRYNAILTKGQWKTMSDSQFAEAMRTEVMPLWNAMYADTSAPALTDGTPEARRQRAMLRYIESRRNLLRQIDGSPDADPKTLRQRMDAARAESDAAAADLKAAFSE